jgi:accessory gene regulator protein AgrB
VALLLFILSYFRWPPWFGGWVAAAAFNLLFLAHAMLWIRQGCRQVRMGLAAVGCLLFSLLAFTRYADLFESLVLRGLVFLAVGAILFITGVRYARAKSAATGEAT